MPTSSRTSSPAKGSKSSSPARKTPSPPPTVTVYVAIYNPTDSRDPCHWAIYINGGRSYDVILQVSDDKKGVGYFVEKAMWGKYPQKSSMHKASIPVGTIYADKIQSVVALLNSTPVDNRSTTWNCQAWCVDALNGLHALYSTGKYGFKWDTTGYNQVIRQRQNWQ